MKKRVVAFALTLVLAVGLTPAWAADIKDIGYYTAEGITAMGGDVHDWWRLLDKYGVKEANLYGWYCSLGDQGCTWADELHYYSCHKNAVLNGNDPAYNLEKPVTQEDLHQKELAKVKERSEEMYQYLTTDDISFEEAAGIKTQTQPKPNQSDTTPTPNEPVNPDITFVDVNEGDWYYEAVMTMARNGIVNGKGNGVFDPNANITIGEMCALICRLDTHVYTYPFRTGETLNTANYGERTFDEPTSWAHQYIMAVRNAGDLMVSNYNLPKWDPEAYAEPIRRGEAMWVCVAFANRMVRYNYPYGGYWTASYRGHKDGWRVKDNDIPDVYVQVWENDYDRNEHFWDPTSHVQTAYRLGIVQGVDAEHNCNASGNLTRAEMCQMFYNMGLTTDTNVNNPYYVPESYYTIPTERPW